MKITVSRRLLGHFRREAKRIYPKEAFAVLLGTSSETSLHITELFIPDQQERFSTPLSVPYANVWLRRAKELASASGLDILGEIHSHADKSSWKHDTTPSQDDWTRSIQVGSKVHGVCSLRKYPSGRMVARVEFWPALPVLQEKITP